MPHTYTDIPGAGTTLQLQIASVYTDVPGATDISWDGLKRSVRNPTSLTSPAVVKKPGMPDFGQIKLKVYFDPNNTVHTTLRTRLLTAAAAATVDNWKLIYADGLSTPADAEFTGFISEFGHASGDAETGTMTADMTVEVNTVTAFNLGSPLY